MPKPMQPRTQRLPMPPTEARLHELVGHLLRLSGLLELRVTPQGVAVTRGLEDVEEPVVPETLVDLARGVVPDEPDLAFLLQRVELEALPLDPARHQLHVLLDVVERVRRRGYKPCAWYVAQGDDLDAYLAQPMGTVPAWLFAIPVRYVSADDLPPGKLVLLGSKTGYAVDAAYGVAADMEAEAEG